MNGTRIRPTVAQVDLGAIRHNCALLRALLAPGVLHMAVVKANGYGHGDLQVARACLEAGVDRLGVALVEEGVRLRLAGVDAPILVLGDAQPEAAETIVAHGLTPTVGSTEAIGPLGQAATRAGRRVPVHVAVDTGMRREGVAAHTLLSVVRAIASADGLELEGVWTHLACADDVSSPVTESQLALFHELLGELASHGLRPPIAHAANSAATMLFPSAHLDLVRTGIAVYGLAPATSLRGRGGLRPAMRITSRVVAVRRVSAGDGVGYGHTWSPDEDTDVALVPLGYADGFARLLSSRGQVLVGGVRRPVAGRVSMDQIVVDCGRGGVAPGDEVVVLGRQGEDEITADEIADRIGTINYEIVASVGRRVAREYLL